MRFFGWQVLSLPHKEISSDEGAAQIVRRDKRRTNNTVQVIAYGTAVESATRHPVIVAERRSLFLQGTSGVSALLSCMPLYSMRRSFHEDHRLFRMTSRSGQVR